MNALVLHESSRGIDTFTVESSLLRKRILFFNEEVTAASANQLIEYLLYLDAEDPGKEITLFISSPGGEISAGLAVYHVIQMLKSPVRTIVAGSACSMGAILFLSGKRREMIEGSTVMIHDPLLSSSAGIKRALELDKEAKRLMEMRTELAGIIAERTGRSLEEVLEKTKEDCWLDAAQAIEFGIATGICNELPM